MSNNKYVILTGSKNNAGDFLIKYRAKQIFSCVRADREIQDLDAWEKFDSNTLDQVNQSKALILMGGPALQHDMWPGVYKLTDNLDDIHVPIIMMGIGWYSKQGNWNHTYNYELSVQTKKLLKKIGDSGYLSSVRDFHTLNSLWFHGVKNVLMTGCPAYYNYDNIGKEVIEPKVEKIAFSLGVSFIHSEEMEKLMKDNILKCKSHFSGKNFIVAFHHSLESKIYLNSHNSNLLHLKAHERFVKWLVDQNIEYVDISGSAENLINFYNGIDLHIGYRVHAHIFMNSVSKFSILLSEDGRAKATYNVIGGIVLDGVNTFKDEFVDKVFNKLNLKDKYSANLNLSDEIILNIDYEINSNFNRMKNSRKQIDQNYVLMHKFLEQLP